MERILPKRKPNRLNGFDYSAAGSYFITICTHQREKILSQVCVGEAICLPQNPNGILHLTGCGEMVKDAILRIPEIYPSVSVDRYVIMPNHVHLILKIDYAEGGRQIASPTFIHNFANTKIDSAILYPDPRTVGDAGPYKLPIFFAKTKIDSAGLIFFIKPPFESFCGAFFKKRPSPSIRKFFRFRLPPFGSFFGSFFSKKEQKKRELSVTVLFFFIW